jgi:3-hydroxyacyl-[acyl-carrier-protein] dehydratase
MRLEYFQLIDRIVALDLDARTIAVHAQVPETSTIFEGHFPGHPLMPGVLLIEAMAQTCGWLLIGLNGFARMPFLAAVKEAKLRTFVTPGQALAIAGRIEHDGSGYAMAHAETTCDGKAICEADLTFRIVPFPDPSLRTGMEDVARKIGFPLEATTHG